MSKPWYVLDIDITDALNKDFSLEVLQSDQCPVEKFYNGYAWLWHYRRDQNHLLYSKDWLEYMNKLGLTVNTASIFYRPAYYVHPDAHIDVPDNPGGILNPSINWVVGDDDSDMVWFEMPDTPGNSELPGQAVKNVNWPMDTLTEVGRHTIGSRCTLVRTDIPHNIIVRSKPRLLVSTRVRLFPTNWEDNIKLLEKFIIE